MELQKTASKKAYFNGVDFSNQQAPDAIFAGFVFCNCKFDGANLEGANFAGAKFFACSFKGTNLSFACLADTTFTPYCDLGTANLTGTITAGSNLKA